MSTWEEIKMRKTTKRALAAMTSAFMMFSLLPGMQTFAAEKNTGSSAYASVDWQARTFGQSTDLNFKSTIAENKVGVNGSEETKIQVTNSEGKAETKDAVIMESRGGKIANTHDGLTFYYVKLPTSENFKLSANVYIDQLGPEEVTGSAPSKQEACGIMVRDMIGGARNNPMVDGEEELTAASNDVAAMFVASAKTKQTIINVNAFERNGVTDPSGNKGVTNTNTKFATVSEEVAVTTTDYTPAEGTAYEESKFMMLTLERTNDSFIVTYTDADGKTSTKAVDGADRVAVYDKDNMYAGFFASRNAKMTVTDIELENTGKADTVQKGFTVVPYGTVLQRACAETTGSDAYTVRLRSNYDGKVTIKQDGTVIADAEAATAGTFYEKATTLTKDETTFEYTYKISETESKTDSFTVKKNESYKNRDLYVSTKGTGTNAGTKESPLDVATALSYVSEGYTVYVQSGQYDVLTIPATLSGSADKMKSIVGYGDREVVFVGTSTLSASNWNIKNISITGSSTTGFRVNGHNNTIEQCKFYGNGDTGLQISGGSGTDPLVWPTNNHILNCESYDNVDTSCINADGFAAKLGVGEGNVFEGCISHNNADDGWDLFNKIEDGANCPVTIKNCIAYENGVLLKSRIASGYIQAATGSIGNGFKLGGEGLSVNHVVKNCISYNNNMDGFTDNFNRGKLTLENNTAYDNVRYNYIMRRNGAESSTDQGYFNNNLSYRSNNEYDKQDHVSGNVSNCYFYTIGQKEVVASDFAGLTIPAYWNRTEDGAIAYTDFLRVKTASKLATAGVNGTYVGALQPQKVTEDKPAEDKPVEDKPVEDKPSQDAPVQDQVKSFTITFNSNSGQCVVLKQSYETMTSLPAATREGYKFAGWYTSKTGGNKVTAESLTKEGENRTVYAHWTAEKYNVTLHANGGYIGKKGVTTKTTTVTFAGNYSLRDASKAGYTFKGWYTKKTGGSKVTVKTKVATAKNTTLYAQYSKVKVAKSQVTSLKNTKTKQAVVTAKKVTDAAGYQVRYSTKANLKGAKTVTAKTNKNITIKKLKKNSKVYVQVRAFKYDSTGKKVYGTWSKASKVTIKK